MVVQMSDRGQPTLGKKEVHSAAAAWSCSGLPWSSATASQDRGLVPGESCWSSSDVNLHPQHSRCSKVACKQKIEMPVRYLQVNVMQNIQTETTYALLDGFSA